MSTDIAVSGALQPSILSGLWHPTQANELRQEIETQKTNLASYSIFTALGETQSLTRNLLQNPGIRLLQTRINSNSTVTILDESKVTRGLVRNPELRLPQDVVAQNHPVNVIDSDAVPIQIWEGCVQSVNIAEGTMKASLTAKMGVIPEHVGTIDLQWVPDQDSDLVKLGAVFYLTLFKRVKKGGSIENSQSIQFRRRPNWSKSQLVKINEQANMFLSKIKNKTIAD
jgi:hypothetical protein